VHLRILVTGGCGFIGSNFVRHVLSSHPQDQVVNLDLLTYAGNPENLSDVEADFGRRYRLVRGDVGDRELCLPLMEQAEAVVHFAAESHVDRSIEGGAEFLQTNVLGTHNLLECARQAWGGDQSNSFVHVSTDEVYGALELDDAEMFTEERSLAPRNPYSASKAAADHLAQAYFHTHGLPVKITRCSNTYGPFQFPEKLVPLMIANIVAGEPLPIYGDGLHVRDWLYVLDNCRGTDAVLRGGRPGQAYNVGGNAERPNLEVVRLMVELVCERLGLDLKQRLGLIRHIADRPGHDRRYATDAGKLQRELGIEPATQFEQGLVQTVDWYLDNRDWCQRVTSGAYQDYYRKMYGRRLERAGQDGGQDN
jgi:dTDP-glucose 4,6-dehydratase